MAQIARIAGLDRAGTRRILLTLEHLGYVRCQGKRYSLTPRVLQLGYAYLSSLPFWRLAQPVMEELVEEIRETSSIGVLDGDDVVFVFRVPTRRLLSFDPRIGSHIPAYVHSMGRILLAQKSDEDLDIYLNQLELQTFTAHTISSIKELAHRLKEDRKNGWSFVTEQYEEGLCGIATPIFDSSGACVAALNVSIEAGDEAMDRAITKILPKLRLAARRMNADLG